MATESRNVDENDEVSVRELILGFQNWVGYLWSRWRVLLAAGILGGALGLLYSLVKTPIYTATTTFVIEGGESKGGLGRLAGMAAMAGIDLGSNAGGLFQGDNILELYKTRKMLVEVLLTEADSNELLIDRYLVYNGLNESWAEKPELSALDFRRDPGTLNPNARRLRDSVLTIFANSIRKDVLKVEKPDKDLALIQVSVTSPDEVFSKAFNDNLVKRVNEFYAYTKTKKTTSNIAILEAKVDSVRAIMSGAIYSAAKVSDATPNLNPTRQVQRVAPAQEAQFSAEANRAILAQLLQNLELTKMAQMQEQPLIQLVDQPIYPLPIDQLGKRKGIIIGGFLFGFLAALGLTVQRWYHSIMQSRF